MEHASKGERGRTLYIVLVSVVVLLIMSGLIFIKKKVEAGLLVLSHLGALVSGALPGWGWEKGRQKE